jgi:hypothetical protein
MDIQIEARNLAPQIAARMHHRAGQVAVHRDDNNPHAAA